MLPLTGYTVGIQRATESDDVYGDPTVDPRTPGTPRYEDCHVQQESSSKSRQDPGRKSSNVIYHFWFEASVDVLKSDTLLFNGKTLEIEGEPTRWDSLGFAYTELIASDPRG